MSLSTFPQPHGTKETPDNDAITSFTLAIPQDLEDLNRRIDQTRWPDARSVILGALGAINIAAASGVPGGRETIVANLLVGMVSDIEAIAC